MPLSFNWPNQGAAIELAAALAKLPMWGGFSIVRPRVGSFAALARLHFSPFEIFAQRRFQAILS